MSRVSIPHPGIRLAVAVTALATACADGSRTGQPGGDTVVAYVAASLMHPLRATADSFSRQTGTVVLFESGGSLEHARKVTELGRIPDVLLLADHEVFDRLLVPSYVGWYVQFARNRMVIAHTPRSRFAGEIGADNWHEVLQRPGVEVGRPDPDRAPAGYRTLLVMQLAESYYGERGLAARLLARAPPRNVRADAAELAVLLEAGEIDYIFEYESLARSRRFRYVTLPSEIDLGDPAFAPHYARASVRVAGLTPRDSVTFRGSPILFGLGIPLRAPNPRAAAQFVDFLLGDGKRLLRAAHVNVLDMPRVVGEPLAGVPLPASLRPALHSGDQPR